MPRLGPSSFGIANANNLTLRGGGLGSSDMCGWETIQILRGLGWSLGLNRTSLDTDTLVIPYDAAAFVRAYLDAGTGEQAVSSRMPMLIWLVQVDVIQAAPLLAQLAHVRNAHHIQALFADQWCRDVLLNGLPVLPPARAADEWPNTVIDVSEGGIEASQFVCDCVRNSINGLNLDAKTVSRFRSLDDMLRNWESYHRKTLMSDTLWKVAQGWGVTMVDGGTINLKLADRLFRAIGNV